MSCDSYVLVYEKVADFKSFHRIDDIEKIYHRDIDLAHIENISIQSCNLRTLQESHWLDDNIINAFLTLISTAGKSKHLDICYIYLTQFYQKIATAGYKSVDHYTNSKRRYVNIFALVSNWNPPKDTYGNSL